MVIARGVQRERFGCAGTEFSASQALGGSRGLRGVVCSFKRAGLQALFLG